MAAPVVVVGAGPAGLATAATLKKKGFDSVLVDRADHVGANWRTRYDGLRLNTVRWLSHLPGHRIPPRTGRWVGRDDFVEYLELYARHHGLELHSGVEVLRLDPGPDGWHLSTSVGGLDARAVAVATGAFDQPVTPSWPGLAQYRGELCHASAYRSPGPYRGRDVLVVGAGATGLEVAALLADGGAGRIRLSVRSCQNLFTRQWRGLPLTPAPAAQHLPTPVLNVAGALLQRLLGSDWPSPLPSPAAGLGTSLRRDGAEPVVADGVVEKIRDGRIGVVPGVAGLTADEVVLDDGRRLRPDAVILATGYTNCLGKLVGHLGVLAEDGLPIAEGGEPSSGAPGLVFIGFQPTVTGRLLRMPGQARAAARTFERLLPG